MKKRQFLSYATGFVAGALGGSLNSAQALESLKNEQKSEQNTESQVILTITGAIEHVNRKKSDDVLDQLMHKQGIHFNRGYTFTLADLEKLPVVTINPTLEYDGHVHELSGPRLVDVLKIVGIIKSKGASILMHGIDGYSPEVSLNLVHKYDYILATRLDGQLLSIGGFGPLFAIYDADRIADLSQKPLDQRFAMCPWGLYCMEVIDLS